MKTQIYLNSADFFAALGESKALMRCEVVCRLENQSEFKETLVIKIELSDTSLTLEEIERLSIEKAKDFIKAIAYSI